MEELEIIASKDGKRYMTYMTANEWAVFEKKKGFKYIAYQKGFSGFKPEENAKN